MAAGCVFVTGATGGIGTGIARRFARAGRPLAISDRTSDGLEELARSLETDGSPRVSTYCADQSIRDDIDLATSSAKRDFGRIDVLIANAGYARQAGFLDMPEKIWRRHVDVNLNGTFSFCQSAARLMAEDRMGGNIVVISSCLATFHADQVGAYCATKAALLMLVRTMAAELGVHGIRANAVLPGTVETAMTRDVLNEPGRLSSLLGETPVGRLGKPEDIAEAAFFLAGETAGFITGAALLADGGQSIYGQPAWTRQDRSVPHEPRWVSTIG